MRRCVHFGSSYHWGANAKAANSAVHGTATPGEPSGSGREAPNRVGVSFLIASVSTAADRCLKLQELARMSFVLILQFVLNGHVHTVNTGRAFSSQQECSVAGQQAKSYANLAPGERYSFSCRPSDRHSLSR